MSSSERPDGGGADDDAADEAVRLAERLDDAAQPRALLPRLDLARHADVIDRRHEHQEPSRHGDVRGQAGALGAERLLDDLDEDLLPFFQQVLDLRLGPVALAIVARLRPRLIAAAAVAARAAVLRGAAAASSAGPAQRLDRGERLGRHRRHRRHDRLLVLVLARLEPVELLDGVDDLGDVQERVAFQADVNEGGLHAGEDLGDPPLVDVADHAARSLALDEDFDDLIVFENGDPRIVVARGDDHLLVHG